MHELLRERSIDMNGIIDYAKSNSALTFKEHPLSDVDSLILSQLSYLYFDGIVNETIKFDTALSDILKAKDSDKLYNNIRVPDLNKQLLKTVANSVRYSNTEVGYYVNEFDKETEKQFSAITFRLDKKLYYVAYRGTDSSFVGWKEDFNMSFMSTVPAQQHAVTYFENLAHAFPRAKFILGGHSKGGNLAVYACVFSSPKFQKRIVDIYNHDGPGFKDEILNLELPDKAKFQIHKTIPQSSIVGMLLQKNESYKVVVSNGFAITQHDPFTWETDGLDFKYTDDITDLSKSSGAVIEQWLEHTDEETREMFIDAFFNLISDTSVTRFSELFKDVKNNAPIIVNSIKTTDPEVRKVITKTLSKLLSIVTDEVKINASYKLAELQITKPAFLKRNDTIYNILHVWKLYLHKFRQIVCTYMLC